MKYMVVVFYICLNSTSSKAQKKLQPFIAAYIAMDAEAVYFGPSVALGVEKKIKQTRVGINAHYFTASINSKVYGDTGILRIFSGSLMAEKYLFKNKLKKIYGGIGVTYQYRYEDYKGFFILNDDERFNWMPCFKLGYTLSNKNSVKPQLHIELFGTGPYKESTVNSSYTEVLTQLSVGCKLTF